MSEENVEVVRRVNRAFDERDVDALLAEHHPDVEVVVLRSEIEGPYRGHDGLRRMVTEAFEADMEIRVDDIRDYGNRVLVVGRQHATVRGVAFDRVLAEIYELAAGQIVRMQAFARVEDALEAVAGLRE
jgi:ketosteroid isomerase-like protein